MGVTVIGVIVPCVFALFTLLIGIGFCCARSCCSGCGERIATQKYTKKQIIWLKVGFSIWTVFLIVMCVLSIIANHSVSTGLNNTVDSSDDTFNHVLAVQSALNEVSTPFDERITRARTLQTAIKDMAAIELNFTVADVYLNWGLVQTQADISTDISSISNTTTALDGLEPLRTAASTVEPAIATVVDREADFVAFGTSSTALASDINDISQATLPSASALFTAAANTAVQAKDAALALTAASSLGNTLITKGLTAAGLMEDLSLLKASTEDVYARIQASDDSQCAADRAVLDDVRLKLANIDTATTSTGSLGGVTLQDTLVEFATPYQNLLLPYFTYAGLSIDAAATSAADLQAQYTALDGDAEFNKLLNFDLTDSSPLQTAFRSVSALQTLKLTLAEATNTTSIDRTQLMAVFDAVLAAIADFTASDSLSRSVADLWSDVATRTQAFDPTGIDALIAPVNFTAHGHEHLALVPIETRFLALNLDVVQAQYEQSTAAQTARDSLYTALIAARDALEASVITSARDGVDSIAQEYESTSLSTLQVVSDALDVYVGALEGLNIAEITAVAESPSFLTNITQRQTQVDTLVNMNLASLQSEGEAYKFANLYQLLSELLYPTLVTLLTDVDSTCSTTTLSAAATTNTKTYLGLFTDASAPTGSDSMIDLSLAYEAVYADGNTAAADLDDTVDSLSFALPTSAVPTALPTDFKDATAARESASTYLSNFTDNLAVMEANKNALTNGDLDSISSSTSALRAASSSTDASFAPIETGLEKIDTGTVLSSSSAHHVVNYLLDALLVNDNMQPLVDADRDAYLEYIVKMGGVLDEIPDDLDEMISDMDTRITELETTLSDLFSFADDYYSMRKSVKREGYTLDEQRLIIVDVVVLVLTVLVVFGLLAAMLSRHKCLMMMVMMMIPLVSLLFLFAGVHFTPGLLFVDTCRDSSRNIVGFIGDHSIDEASINGVISYLGESLTGPVTVGEIYTYLYDCGSTPKPEFLSILLDVSATSPGLTRHDMADFRQSVTDNFAAANLTMASELTETFTTLSQTSTVLADKSHEIGNLVTCEVVQPLLLQFVDDSMCYELVGSIAILGCLLFLHALCLIPGLFLGCRGFKRFNIRNSVEYKRVIRHMDGVLIIDGGTTDRNEVVKLKHREMALKSGVSLGQLKGFTEGTVVNFSYNNDNVAPPPPSSIPPPHAQRRVETSTYSNQQPDEEYSQYPPPVDARPRGNSSFSGLGHSQSSNTSYISRGMDRTTRSAQNTPTMGPSPSPDLPRVSNSRSNSRSISLNNAPSFMSNPATRSQNHIELSRLR